MQTQSEVICILSKCVVNVSFHHRSFFFPDCLLLAFTSIGCCFLLYIASILFMRIKFTTCLKLRDIENPKPAAFAFCDKRNKLLQATTGARNRNLQVVIYYACVACTKPAFIKNVWCAQKAIWSRAFRPSTPRRLIRACFEHLSSEK